MDEIKKNKLFEHGKYLARLMGAAILRTKAPLPDFELDGDYLCELAITQSVANTVYEVLENLGILSFEQLKKLQSYYLTVAMREARQQAMTERIFSVLEKDGIDYVPLKGFVIKNIYPSPSMRFSADVDFLIHKSDSQKVKIIMESLGFEFEGGDYHLEFTKKPYHHYEAHVTLLPERSQFYGYFSDFIDRAVVKPGFKHYKELKNEDMYLHLLIHIYKHFVNGGCGLRLFADIWLFRMIYPNADYGYIERELTKLGLNDFDKALQNISLCFFEGKPYGEKEETLASFIFVSGTFGSKEVYDTAQLISGAEGMQNYEKTRRSFILKSWFLDVENMSVRYPVLKKAPILLPFCWIHKGFYTLFCNRSALKRELDKNKTNTKSKAQKLNDVYTAAGLKNNKT